MSDKKSWSGPTEGILPKKHKAPDIPEYPRISHIIQANPGVTDAAVLVYVLHIAEVYRAHVDISANAHSASRARFSETRRL